LNGNCYAAAEIRKRSNKHGIIMFYLKNVTQKYTDTLKRQRPIWKGDQELVKRSGRDESTWVVTHLYMKAMLGISLYSYPYLN
jgi:hypothetical protein